MSQASGSEGGMAIALAEARAAGARGEVPVGACLVGPGGDLLARAGNSSIALSDPSAHAEILVLREAGRVMGNYRLPGTTLYVTIEPCAMCMGALVHARVERLVFGAADPKAGAAISQYAIGLDGRLNHRVLLEQGVMDDECSALLKNFFLQKRRPVI